MTSLPRSTAATSSGAPASRTVRAERTVRSLTFSISAACVCVTGGTVAAGRVKVVLELLAPNMRPVQTTEDLAGFWERLYPELKKALSRRYPKHHWPE